MKAGQLDKLSLKQLRELQDVIAAAISAREVHERSELRKSSPRWQARRDLALQSFGAAAAESADLQPSNTGIHKTHR